MSISQHHHQQQQQQQQQQRSKPLNSSNGTNGNGKSFLAAYAAYRRRDDHAEALAATIQSVGPELDFLGPAARCLSIATGTGRHEIEFVAALMPSVGSFVAVEPDADSAAELRVNLARRLPHVDGAVLELPVEIWEGPESPFDVVLVFHFLYYFVDPDVRRQFCRRLYAWTVAGGRAVVLMDRHDEGPNGIHKLCRAADAERQIPSYDRTRSDLEDAGFRPEREYEFRYSRDWTDPDPDLLRFVQLVRGVQLVSAESGGSLDEIRAMMHRMRIDRKSEGRTILAVFRKVAPGAV